MGSDLDSFLDLAMALADAGGGIARRYFRARVDIVDKSDGSPVTIADREAETAMRRLIEERFPEHGIIGEEHGRVRAEAEHVWVLDPIDGTKSFVIGRPLFGGLIALLRDGKPILGVIDCPAAGERWVGAAGRPTTHQGQPVITRGCAELGLATMSCTSPTMFDGDDAAAFTRVRRATKFTAFGGDCYGYGLVAAGFSDLVIEGGLQPYDFLALAPIIEGAGGVFTDWQGRPVGLSSDGRVIAAGDARLHRQVLELLGG